MKHLFVDDARIQLLVAKTASTILANDFPKRCECHSGKDEG